MDDDDGLIGEIDAWIGTGYGLVIPSGDLAEENPGECFRSELHFTVDAWDVVRGNHRAENRWDVEDLYFGLRQLLVAHGAVTGAEIYGLGQNLADAATAADGLIVELHIGMGLVVLTEPFLVHRIRKSGTRSVQRGLSKCG